MDFGLTDKKAFVGGASRGIGKAIALELAREGCDVVIASRTVADLEQAAQEIAEATGRNIIPIAMDATSREQVDAAVNEAAERLGGLHILVNSASLPGGSADAVGPIDTVNEDSLISDFDVKYVGALRCARAAIPHLKEQGWGRIINISGGNGRTAGNLSGGARNVSMVHLTKTLAIQMGRFGITVNCIHPGTTRTERTPGLLEGPRGAAGRQRRGGGGPRLRARLPPRQPHLPDGGRLGDRLPDVLPGVGQGLGRHRRGHRRRRRHRRGGVLLGATP